MKDLKESNEFLSSLLDNIDSAVMVVDQGAVIQQFNSSAEALFDKPVERVEGVLCGNAMGCVYAVVEDARCGKTSHCGECQLRRSVVKALEEKVLTFREKLVRKFYIGGEFVLKHFEFSTKFISFDGEGMILIVVHDVTTIEAQRLELVEKQKHIEQQNTMLEDAYGQLRSNYQRLEREHGLAAEVLARVCSKDFSRFPNVRVQSAPVETVGGDVFFVAERPSGGAHLLLGDFTGHGLSAALGAIPTADTFYKMTADGRSMGDILKEINRKLKSVLPTGLFLCAAMVELDEIRRTATVWNGGLPDVLIISEQGELKHRLASKHLPLGILNETQFDAGVETIAIECGDCLYSYSDGIIEARGQLGEMFGQQRLEADLSRTHAAGSRLDGIVEALGLFCHGVKRDDDFIISEVKLGAESSCR
jgi:serine phosphatase RsbU (regulator of sigma subunit)